MPTEIDGPPAPEDYLQDEDYFASYADPGVHRLMIQDHARTDAYRRALEALAPGRRVLDVGTGTGVLAMFAARAGAASVTAVDSSSIVDQARRIAHDNGLSGSIEFHRAQIEELALDGPFDLVVSEWMGFFGLAELMFRSVLAARDRWLAPGGVLVPSRLRLRVGMADDPKVHEDLGTGLWERPVYGLDFRRMIDHELASPICAACDLDPSALLGPAATVLDLDLAAAREEDFFFSSAVTLPVERAGHLRGLCGWFEVDLAPGITLSCAPDAPRTHWRQSYFPFRPFEVRPGDELHLAMSAHPPEFGDRRLPVYFIEAELVRDGEALHKLFYRHFGSFE